MEIIRNPNFEFLAKARDFVVLSILVIAAGILWIARGNRRYGVEFSGGTQLLLRFKAPPEIDRVRDAVAKVSPGAVIQVFGETRDNQVLVRIAGEASESDLDAPARAIMRALGEGYAQNAVTESSSEIVGPVAGAELPRESVLPTG